MGSIIAMPAGENMPDYNKIREDVVFEGNVQSAVDSALNCLQLY